MSSRPEGESKVLGLRRQAEGLCERLEESRKAEIEHLVNAAEQQWRSVLQAAGQAELRALSEDFDTQSHNSQSWIREKQQELQSVGSHTPAEERSRTAQVCSNGSNIFVEVKSKCRHVHLTQQQCF